MVKKSRKKSEMKKIISWIKKEPWVILVVVWLIVMAGIYIVPWKQAISFEYVSGDDNNQLVLLRSNKEVSYTLRYTGEEAIELLQIEFLWVTSSGMMHTGFDELRVIVGDQEVITGNEGDIPAGETITLQPGEEFTVVYSIHGETLGVPYLKSIQIYYNLGDSERMDVLELEEQIRFSIE